MNPVTHGLIGWLVANSNGELERRDRGLITLAGVLPDVDGLGVIPEFLTRNSEAGIGWWSDFHHVVGHNLTVAVLYAALCFALARKRMATAALAFASFNLHIMGDVIGGRGQEGEIWPIAYLWPLRRDLELNWDGAWALNAWPNIVVTLVALTVTFWLAWRRGYSPVGIFSPKADRRFIETLRARLPRRR